MEFKPRTEREIAERQLLSHGPCTFEIIEATETTSQAGNAMFEMKVLVTKDSLSRVLTDYILPQRPAKFRNCCIACNVEDKYLNGSVRDDDFLGKRGKAIVGVERAKKGFSRRNVIVDYLPNAKAAVVIREGRKYA